MDPTQVELYNVTFSDVPIFDGAVDITSLYLLAGLSDVCSSVYWCLKMNARLYLMSLVFLLIQHSLVFRLCLVLYEHCSHLKKMQYIILINWYSLITNQEGSSRWECCMKGIYVHSFCGYKCGLYLSSLQFIWCWSFMSMVMCLWVHISKENLEYRFFMWHYMVW